MNLPTRSMRARLVVALLTSFFFTSPASALSCPDGTKLVAQDRPQGKEERCILQRSRKRHGPFQIWYRNGNLRQEGSYRYGQPQGRWTYYYPSGQKRMEGDWRFGKAYGTWTYWYENGTRESAGRFRAGKREGRWTYWDTDGKVRFRGNWVDGKLDLEGAQASAREHGASR